MSLPSWNGGWLHFFNARSTLYLSTCVPRPVSTHPPSEPHTMTPQNTSNASRQKAAARLFHCKPNDEQNWAIQVTSQPRPCPKKKEKRRQPSTPANEKPHRPHKGFIAVQTGRARSRAPPPLAETTATISTRRKESFYPERYPPSYQPDFDTPSRNLRATQRRPRHSFAQAAPRRRASRLHIMRSSGVSM